MASQRDGGIAWTQETWNPVRGCSRVSHGCVNCYAERQAARFVWQNVAGEGGEIQKPGPFHGFVTKVNGHPAWTGKVELVERHLHDPLNWKTPKRIFVNSMSDLFHESLSIDHIALVFATMAEAGQHQFQVLTKRAKRMSEIVPAIKGRIALAWETFDGGRFPWPLPNVWLGVSVENQETADERIPPLLQTPAAVRFVSYEPALGPVDFNEERDWLLANSVYRNREMGGCKNSLDWIIVGGESGPGARPFDIAWARNTIEQCKSAGVGCFVKQLGKLAFDGWEPIEDAAPDTFRKWLMLKDPKGGDWTEWPNDLRVREFPTF